MSTESQSPSLVLEAAGAAPPATNLLTQWWVAFAASTVCVLCGHLMIKAGLNASMRTASAPGLLSRILHILSQPQVIIGLLVYVLGTLCWMAAVAKKEISFLYPLTSVNYVLVAAFSTAFFGEVITVRRLAGIAGIVLGMILMNRRSGREAQ